MTKSRYVELFSPVVSILDAMPRERVHSGLYSIEKVAQVCGTADFLRELAETLRLDGPALARLTKQSYLHENGFVKATLFDSPDGRFRIRLHFWREVAKTRIPQNIHNHRFDFFSTVLVGSLSNNIWDAARAGRSFSHYEYLPRLGQKSYTLSFKGEELLLPASERQIHRGGIYFLDKSELHTTGLGDGTIITLFVEDRLGLKDYADIYSEKYPAENTILASPAISSASYIRALETISKRLADDGV